jgi:hypothetical protein
VNAKNLIKTTGDLREFLAMTIEDVASGDIDLDKATHITKLAAQVNESFYSEIKVARIRNEMGDKILPLGDMTLGSSA